MEISTIDLVLIISVIICITISILLYLKINKLSSHYNKITKDVKGKNLEEILSQHLERIKNNITQVDKLEKSLDQIKKEGFKHLQKIGFKRFNPFHETGGNQSFILAILDLNNNGFIISSLHQRETTRVYAKRISKGEAKNKLSKEEQEVLKQIT